MVGELLNSGIQPGGCMSTAVTTNTDECVRNRRLSDDEQRRFHDHGFTLVRKLLVV
jgi:hypothetical protein